MMKKKQNDFTYLKIGFEMSTVWLSCLILLPLFFPSIFMIFPFSLGTIIACLSILFPNKQVKMFRYLLFFAFLLGSLFFPLLLPPGLPFVICFLPLAFFVDADDTVPYMQSGFLLVVSFLLYSLQLPLPLIFLLISLSALSHLIAVHILREGKLKIQYADYFQSSKHEKMRMKKLYDTLSSEQDHRIENAILNERNRISRDIHDSLGHLTSRGILQIGAMLVTEKDAKKKEQLSSLKATLSEGMEEVRNSLHNFQNESLSLETELKKIVRDFTFCPLYFTYSLKSEGSLKFKYSILFIIKEALTNITVHSNATKAEVSLIETGEALYIKILDNGTEGKLSPNGMGIFSIRKRVEELNGKTEISIENGFRIFITLNKEGNP